MRLLNHFFSWITKKKTNFFIWKTCWSLHFSCLHFKILLKINFTISQHITVSISCPKLLLLFKSIFGTKTKCENQINCTAKTKTNSLIEFTFGEKKNKQNNSSKKKRKRSFYREISNWENDLATRDRKMYVLSVSLLMWYWISRIQWIHHASFIFHG